MKKFFFKISISYSDKNKLYRDVSAFIKLNDSTLIIGEKRLIDFTQYLTKGVEQLNAKHNRCKPLLLNIWRFDNEDNETDIQVQVSGCFAANIYPVASEW